MRAMARAAGLLLLALAAQTVRAGNAPDTEEMRVSVSRNGAAIAISVDMPVEADPQQVWRVLTDYDHMASFSPNLTSSKAVPLAPNRLRVEQAGVVTFGPLRFPFESVRDIQLQPYREIRSRAVSGTLKSGFAETRLTERDGITHVEYYSESIPAVNLPFGLGLGTVERRTREQFASLRREIYRRMADARRVSSSAMHLRPSAG